MFSAVRIACLAYVSVLKPVTVGVEIKSTKASFVFTEITRDS